MKTLIPYSSYYQRNRERLLEQIKILCHDKGGKEPLKKRKSKNSRERVQEQTWSKYREIANEEKELKGEYGRNRYINISEEDEKNCKNNIHFHL